MAASSMVPARPTASTRTTAAPLSRPPPNIRQPSPPSKDEEIARLRAEYQALYDKGEDAKNNVARTRRAEDMMVFGATFDSCLISDRRLLKEALRII